jgi:hypothetical protein
MKIITDNTTHTAIGASNGAAFSTLPAGTYHVGVQGTAGNWNTAVAGSSDTFTLSTSGQNGSCTHT